MRQHQTPRNFVHLMKFDNQDYVAFQVSDYNLLTHDEWEELIEDALAARAVLEYRANPKEETYPADLVDRLGEENRIKVFREYRELTQVELAKKAGIDRSYLSDLERGKRQGTTKTMKAIAKALNLDLDDLV